MAVQVAAGRLEWACRLSLGIGNLSHFAIMMAPLGVADEYEKIGDRVDAGAPSALAG